MDKHKIGNAFKEKLTQLNQTPNDLVWNNITKQLDKKEKKKRPFVFWLKTGAVAAVLLFLFTLGYNFYGNKKRNSKIILTKKNNTNLKTKDTKTYYKIKTENQITSTKNNIDNNKNIKTKTAKSNKKSLISRVNTPKNGINIFKNNSFITNLNTKKQHILKPSFHKIIIKQIDKNRVNTRPLEITKVKTDDLVLNNLIKKSNQALKKETLAQNQNLDLTKLNNEFANTDENLKSKKKWKISAKASPVYYSSLTNGSSLDTALKNNSKTSDITLSYAITASYPLNKKLQIRAGISSINLAYNTKEASPVSIINAQALTNIELQNFITNPLFPGIENPFSDNNFDLKQKISYLEFPLEIKYHILDKKLNIDLITGFSALILNKDKILLNNNTIGSVNNLNKLSYTGNLGLGLDYSINKQINFIIEPTIKIQLNTYNDNTDYKPYFFGVYSGFSYQF